MPKIRSGSPDIIIETSYPVKKVIWGKSINGKSMATFQRQFAHSPIQTLRLTKHHQIIGYVDKTAQGKFLWFRSLSELQKARAQQHSSFAVVEKGKEPRCYLGGRTAKPISHSEFLKAHSEGTPSTARYSFWNAFLDVLQLSALIFGGAAGMHRFRGAPATALLAFPAVSHQTVTIGPEMQLFSQSASMPTISSTNDSLFIAWDWDKYNRYQTYVTDKNFSQINGPNTAFYTGSQLTRNPAATTTLQNSYAFAYQKCCGSSCLCAKADLGLYQFGVEGDIIASGDFFFRGNPPSNVSMGAVSNTLGVMWRDPSKSTKSFSTTFDIPSNAVKNISWQQPGVASTVTSFDLAGGDHFSACFSDERAAPNMTLNAINFSTNRTRSLFNWLYTDYNSTQFPRCSICTSNNTDVVAWAYKDGISVFNIQNDQLLPIWNVLYTKNITFSALSVVCAPRWVGVTWSQNNATSLTSSYFAAGDINTNLPLISPTAIHFDPSKSQESIDMALIDDFSVATVYKRSGTGIFGTKLTVNNDSWVPTPAPTNRPTPQPTPAPTNHPTPRPTPKPTPKPTNTPTTLPPTATPSTSAPRQASTTTGMSEPVVTGIVLSVIACICYVVMAIYGIFRFKNKSNEKEKLINNEKAND